MLGAIAARTRGSFGSGTGVTCPLIRIHPAIVAQAAATTAALFRGRFFLGVGTGENLNEHVLGERWPATEVRREMLAEAVEVMRELWRGALVSQRGRHYTVENARSTRCPSEPPDVVVAAGGSEAAALAAQIGDGLVATHADVELVASYERAGGAGPRYGQLTICYAESDEEAVRTAFEWWPNASLRGPLSQELPLPSHFEQAASMVDEDDVAGAVVCGPECRGSSRRSRSSSSRLRPRVHPPGRAGPGGFLRFFERELRPALESSGRDRKLDRGTAPWLAPTRTEGPLPLRDVAGRRSPIRASTVASLAVPPASHEVWISPIAPA